MKHADERPTRDRGKTEDGMASNMQRYFGGSPGSVLVKLIFLSLLVGAFMAYLDVTPLTLVTRIGRAIQSVLGNGFEAVRRLGIWVAYGAMVVVPLWLISRLLNRGK